MEVLRRAGARQCRGDTGKRVGIVLLLEEHGESIEADLHNYYRLDLLDWFRGVHQWPKLYRLLRKLPPDSDYKSDLAMDEKLAARILELEKAEKKKRGNKEDKPAPLTPHGLTRQMSLTMHLIDAVHDLNTTLIAVNLPKGKKAPKARRFPRPMTAVDRLRREQEKNQLDDLLRQAGVLK